MQDERLKTNTYFQTKVFKKYFTGSSVLRIENHCCNRYPPIYRSFEKKSTVLGIGCSEK
jgi:hypothetical protein